MSFKIRMFMLLSISTNVTSKPFCLLPEQLAQYQQQQSGKNNLQTLSLRELIGYAVRIT